MTGAGIRVAKSSVGRCSTLCILVIISGRICVDSLAPFTSQGSNDQGHTSKLCRRSFLDVCIASASACIAPPMAWGMTKDPKTGIALPDVGEIETSIPEDWSDIDNPFVDDTKSSFGRLDNDPDSIFYSEPRFVEHVDDNAVQLMRNYISDQALSSSSSLLDLCSSWTSHIDPSKAQELKRVAGLGMNTKSLMQTHCSQNEEFRT